MRQKLLFGIACLGVFIVLLALLSRDREPRYQGIELSEWLRAYGEAAAETNAPATQQAFDAVTAIGTNALPHLLKWLAYEPAAWRNRLANQPSLPNWLSSLAGSALYRDVNMKRRVYAVNGFRVLGAQAAVAVPELTGRLVRTNHPYLQHYTALALCSMGPDGLHPLIKALHSPDPKLRHIVVTAILQTPVTYGSTALIPGLIHCTKDADMMTAGNAVFTLARMRRDPAQVVPALTNAFSSPHITVRHSALEAFSEQYSSEANSVAPLIQNLLNDPSKFVRFAASNALAKLETQNTTNVPPSP